MMSKEDALIIRNWRKVNSWRKIADLAAIQWPTKCIDAGNQAEGIGLCDEAARILGENPSKLPWN